MAASSKGLNQFLDAAYRLDGKTDALEFYHQWAAEYDDQMLHQLGYTSPAEIAKLLMDQLTDHDAAILDFGCGTGLASVDLAQNHYRNIDGVDISMEMLAVAQQRNIYRQLLKADVTEPLAFSNGVYDAVICSGTFTHGHIDAEPIDEIFRILKPNGLLACTVHVDCWETRGFKAKFEQLTDHGSARQLRLTLGGFFHQGPLEGWFCLYQKIDDE